MLLNPVLRRNQVDGLLRLIDQFPLESAWAQAAVEKGEAPPGGAGKMSTGTNF